MEIEQPRFALESAANAWRSARAATFSRRLAEARAAVEASDGLSSARPDLSARNGASLIQKLVGLSLLAGTITAAILAPGVMLATTLIAVSLVFVVIILLRIWAGVDAFGRRLAPTSALAPARYPTLTILAPLAHEANMVPGLVQALSALNYPADRLDVKFLIEADDRETMDAFARLDLPPQFEVVPVPPNAPRTKPRALNYGLALSTGEIVAVFDAEDRPDPNQPREAVAALMRGWKDLAVVQAPLLVDGARSWIGKQFALEYAVHFGVWLPFLAGKRVPLALGGTSNYFRRDRLVEAGGWDAWNVTEDADLGFRLARFGGRSAMISSPTWEEAPARLHHWFNQRTRWMKGHLQTWLVLHRNPLRTLRDMGWRNFALMELTFGGALLASLSHGLIALWLAYALATSVAEVEGWHALLFGFGYASVVLAVIAARTPYKPWWSLVTMPLYWPLASLAMLRAIVELGFRPHHWSKTPHGVGRSPQPGAPAVAPVDNVIQLEFPFERP